MTQSRTFGDAWNEAQQTLADALTGVWVEHGQWPTYQWVEHQLFGGGLDALETLVSFPIVGVRRHNMLSYADVAYDWWATPPSPESRVRLTIAGLARQHRNPRCHAAVNLFLNLLHAASEMERDIEIDPLELTPLTVTSPMLAERLRTPVDEVNALYDVVAGEHLHGVGGSGRAPDKTWHINLKSEIRVYCGIRNVDEYLATVRQHLTPAPTSTPPRVLSSPVSLATALGYLDVTWQLRTGERLLQEFTDLMPGQATFAFLMVEALLITLRSLGSVTCRFRQAM
jgi:hypothetical protein